METFELVRTLDVWGKEQPCTIRGHWSPGRPPPSSPGGYSHDDPRFSDAGDPGEVEIEEVRDENGRLIPDAVWEGLVDTDACYKNLVEAARSSEPNLDDQDD